MFVLLTIAGRNAGLLILILAGLAISSFAGAATALVMNLSSNPFVVLEIAFWLLGSLEDRSFQHVMLALPFIVAGAIMLFSQRNAFRALSLGEETAQSLGVDVGRLRLFVISGVALGVGGAVAVTGTIGFIGLVAPHLMRPLDRPRSGAAVGAERARRLGAAARRRYRGAHHPLDLRHQGRRADLDHRRAVLPLSDHARTPRARRRRRMSEAALLTAQGLGVTLAGRVVLNDVSLSLSAGHLVALVGPNGAGKTTLLRALAGLIPSDGEIQIGGEALSSLSLRERAKRFGYLPQGHVVHWPLPARDIVALGRYPHGATDPARLSPRDAEAVLRAMQAVDVMEFSERRVTELSGGERSRVALARVLAVEAPVILADEPTASLDPRHQIDVMKNLRATADSGVLVIVVTHDLGLAARFADHVLVLREGRLVSQGAPAEALSEAGDGGRVPDQRLSRGIPARGRDRAVGGYLMRRRLACSGRDAALAMPASAARAASLPRIVSMNVCTDQLLLTLADPEQILGLQPVLARRLAIAGRRHAAAIRCCPAAPRTCCCSSPTSSSPACSTSVRRGSC